MDFTTRLYFYWVSIFLIFYIGALTMILIFWGLDIDFWQICVVFFVVGMIPPGIITAYFSKRLDYMESGKIEPPNFSGQKKATFTFKGKTINPFDEVLQRVDRQWIISYSDRENRVLKFRTDSRMSSWGLGGYLKMEKDDVVEVIVYPMFPKSKRERIMVNQVLRIMGSILNP